MPATETEMIAASLKECQGKAPERKYPNLNSRFCAYVQSDMNGNAEECWVFYTALYG